MYQKILPTFMLLKENLSHKINLHTKLQSNFTPKPPFFYLDTPANWNTRTKYIRIKSYQLHAIYLLDTFEIFYIPTQLYFKQTRILSTNKPQLHTLSPMNSIPHRKHFMLYSHSRENI